MKAFQIGPACFKASRPDLKPSSVPILCCVFYRLLKCCDFVHVDLQIGNVRQVIPDNEANSSCPTEHQPLLKPPTTSVVTLNDCAEDDGYADRMINPSRYNIQDAL